MKKNRIILVFLLLNILNCSQKDENLVVNWKDSISESKEVYELEEIRNFVFIRLAENNVSKNEFIRAYSSRNSGRTAEILKCSVEDVNRMTDILINNVLALRNKYSYLNQIIDHENSIDMFISQYEEIFPRIKKISNGLKKDQQRVGCRYGQYSTCLVLAGYGAAATGGAAILVYAGGSYLCLCSYCSGGWVNWACF
jgi:hypothetical protein